MDLQIIIRRKLTFYHENSEILKLTKNTNNK